MKENLHIEDQMPKMTDENPVIDRKSLTAFETWLRAADYSTGTIEKYLRDMQRCMAWLKGEPADQNHLTAYKHHLMSENRQPTTINAVLSAVNTYCRFADIPVHLNFLKIQKKLFRDAAKELTQPEYEKLVITAENIGKGRLALILETICATGIRVSELQYITVENIAAGAVQIDMKGKIREILLPQKLCRMLKKYAKKEKITSGKVFITGSGKGISRKQIWAEMKALAKTAGIDPEKVFPHNLRHLFATVFYKTTKNLVKLSGLLGHSSVETTRIYPQFPEKSCSTLAYDLTRDSSRA